MAFTPTADGMAHGQESSQKDWLVIGASSLGTVFEWYDFYLYGLLATIISAQFFSGVNDTTGFIFALAAFAAGFAVRPFGALVFGRLGDLVGRKYTFLVTMSIMGGATFAVGLLPSYATVGVTAPVLLLALRLLQGLALGGEYGGAATYVAEHAPPGKRGFYTSWIQTTATLGLFAALLVVIGTRTYVGEAAFKAWGWRIPFLVSIVLLGVSLWIRLQLAESPVFTKMRNQGTTSKAPLAEAFGQWDNLKVVLIALLGGVMGQAVVWYTGQFYALFFLERMLRVDGATTNILTAIALVLATPGFVFFGWLSDKIGRKPIILAGCLLAMITYFPLFEALTRYANPALYAAQAAAPVTVYADPDQ
jgi:MFS family permease